MIEKGITIQNQIGLHVTTATQFAEIAGRYQAQITLKKANDKENMVVDGKIIIQLLALGVIQGEQLILCADGVDEEKAIQALEHLITQQWLE